MPGFPSGKNVDNEKENLTFMRVISGNSDFHPFLSCSFYISPSCLIFMAMHTIMQTKKIWHTTMYYYIPQLVLTSIEESLHLYRSIHRLVILFAEEEASINIVIKWADNTKGSWLTTLPPSFRAWRSTHSMGHLQSHLTVSAWCL